MVKGEAKPGMVREVLTNWRRKSPPGAAWRLAESILSTICVPFLPGRGRVMPSRVASKTPLLAMEKLWTVKGVNLSYVRLASLPLKTKTFDSLRASSKLPLRTSCELAPPRVKRAALPLGPLKAREPAPVDESE